MNKLIGRLLPLLLLCPSLVVAESYTLVAWAPGYPGTREQAQPSMDEFASGVATLAGWNAHDLRAVYYPEIEAGRDAVAVAALVFAPLPVYLEFGAALDLQPLLRVIPEGADVETWTLVARKGALGSAADLAQFKLVGLAGFSPRFVRHVLADWGTLPDTVAIDFSARVLSELRKAATGENIAVLLDSAQAAALERLPFAADLEVVAVSAPTVASLVCRVGQRLPADRAKELTAALLQLDDSAAGAPLLAAIRVTRFEPLSATDPGSALRPWNDETE